MKISKNYFRILFIGIFLALIAFNFVLVTNTNFSNISLIELAYASFPWEENNDDPIAPGQTGTTERCRLDLGGGWFTSSVEYVCWDQYVCPSCTCTPAACGEYF